MKNPAVWISLLASLLFTFDDAAAQELEMRGYSVQFPAGQSGVTLSDRITGYESVVYRLPAREGQVMTVSLAGSSTAIYFNVYGPGQGPGDEALARSDVMGPTVPEPNRFEGPLPVTGDYRISVYQVRAAARRGEEADFTLDVAVTDGAAQLPESGVAEAAVPDEPSFWRVGRMSASDRLNVRNGPSTAYRVLFMLDSGELVHNRGCTAADGGMVWCEVQRVGEPESAGWAAARYLIAAPGPSYGAGSQIPAGTAAPPRPSVDAGTTGRLDCTFDGRARQCPFRSIRGGDGNATVTIAMPGNAERRIEFAAGQPVSSDSPMGVDGELSGDTVIVSVGAFERYVVPNAALFGG